MDRHNYRGLAVFLAVSFIAAWAVVFYLILNEVPTKGRAYLWLIYLILAIPAGTSVLVRKLFPEERNLNIGMQGGPFYFYPLAYVVALTLSAGALGLSVLFGWADWDANLSGLQVVDTNGVVSRPSYVIIAISLLIVEVIYKAIPALAVEYGWRGYLLPRLASFWDRRKAILATGLLWGVWEIPFILKGHNYPHHPALGIPAIIVFCLFLGVFLGYLRLKSGSIFPGALALATINGAGIESSLLFLKNNDLILGGILGVTGMILLALLAVLIYRFGLREPKGEETAAATGS